MRWILALIALGGLMSCASTPHPVVEQVDLPRFMGDWYVVGILPNPIENKARNGIERYTLNADSTIAISYTFANHKHPEKITALTALAKVHDTSSNAEWRVQFFRPFWFPYLVIDLAPDYRYTVIGVPNRKFVWIMSRSSSIANADWELILDNLKTMGYNTKKIRRMPQIWE